MSAYTRQKAKLKYRNRVRLKRTSEKQSSDTHKTPYDRVKRGRERKINIKASERVNVDVFTQNKRQCLYSQFRSLHNNLYEMLNFSQGRPTCGSSVHLAKGQVMLSHMTANARNSTVASRVDSRDKMLIVFSKRLSMAEACLHRFSRRSSVRDRPSERIKAHVSGTFSDIAFKQEVNALPIFSRPQHAENHLKAVHDKVSTLEMNLRKKSLPLHAYILMGALSDDPTSKVGNDGWKVAPYLNMRGSSSSLDTQRGGIDDDIDKTILKGKVEVLSGGNTEHFLARRVNGRRTVVSRFQLTDEKTNEWLTDGRATDGSDGWKLKKSPPYECARAHRDLGAAARTASGADRARGLVSRRSAAARVGRLDRVYLGFSSVRGRVGDRHAVRTSRQPFALHWHVCMKLQWKMWAPSVSVLWRAAKQSGNFQGFIQRILVSMQRQVPPQRSGRIFRDLSVNTVVVLFKITELLLATLRMPTAMSTKSSEYSSTSTQLDSRSQDYAFRQRSRKTANSINSLWLGHAHWLTDILRMKLVRTVIAPGVISDKQDIRLREDSVLGEKGEKSDDARCKKGERQASGNRVGTRLDTRGRAVLGEVLTGLSLSQQPQTGRRRARAMDLDAVLPDVGEFGTYQQLLLWLVLLPAVLPNAFHAYNQLFMAARPDHWCREPAVDIIANSSSDLAKRIRSSERCFRLQGKVGIGKMKYVFETFPHRLGCLALGLTRVAARLHNPLGLLSSFLQAGQRMGTSSGMLCREAKHCHHESDPFIGHRRGPAVVPTDRSWYYLTVHVPNGLSGSVMRPPSAPSKLTQRPESEHGLSLTIVLKLPKGGAVKQTCNPLQVNHYSLTVPIVHCHHPPPSPFFESLHLKIQVLFPNCLNAQ
ncbi:hypothetical protein PR048_026287 [Dryococelus australis]|uniref:Uncharacterized protein n=1 Tax=Dryococelus australis TaxID=614101 RepID=A0ABQ9GKW7_9NEOP|nr:hypothetical protein PR048_026287 [Dryococelus australis]